jgi:hypothetical protein
MGGQSQCLPCPAGQYCALATTATPTDCPAGTFRATDGGVLPSDCEPCPAGRYCLEGAVQAIECGVGAYQPAAGQSECLPCPAGQYCALTTTTAPANCAAGSYRAATGGASAAECTTCPAGAYCLEGATRATDCGAGNFQAATGQSQCALLDDLTSFG